MRFERLKLRHLGPYRGDVDLDFTGMTGQLVAITGPNGAGKSTLLELLPGALFRQCPTRGTLAELATARDAFVEVQVVNGARYTVRQSIDAISQKGETLILDADGKPVLESAKVREADAWLAAHVVSPEVLYSSAFAVQGRRGFLDLSPAERKQVLVRVLGIERLERMADRARETARHSKAVVDELRARLDELPAPDIERLRTDTLTLQARLHEIVEALAGARKALERGKAAAADATRAQEIADQRTAADRRLAYAQEQFKDIETRIGSNRGLIVRASEIRAAVTRSAELTTALAAAREEERAAAREMEAAANAQKVSGSALTRAKSAASAARERVLRAEQRLRDRDRVKAAAGQVAALQSHVRELEEQLKASDDEAEQLREFMLSGKDIRISTLRGGVLRLMQPDLQFGAEIATETLHEDDLAEAKGKQAPERLNAIRSLVGALNERLSKARERLIATERMAARADEMKAAEADLELAMNEQTNADADMRTALAADKDAEIGRQRASLAIKAAKEKPEPIKAEIDKISGLVALGPRLEQANARIEELEAQLPATREQIAAAEAELAALPVVEANTVDLKALEAQVARAEGEEQAQRERVTLAQRAVLDAESTLARREELGHDLATEELQLADWTRLGQDLGRDGLQAMEIDAAIPELNTLANDLLHACHGPRFTVELKTDRLSADGKRTLEGLDVRVLDVEHGRDDLAETYSGGECVIVGEALALALTELACQRAGIERPTLVRDESGAALDPENGRAYVAMLRRAALHIGADRVLFVTHTPELQELADARIAIGEDGTVRA